MDNMRGVSANVMCGQFGYFGTGAFNLILDLNAMEQNNQNPEMVSFRNYQDDVEDTLRGAKQAKKDMSCDRDTVQMANYLNEEEKLDETCDDNYDMGF